MTGHTGRCVRHTLRTELHVASHTVNKRRYFSVCIANMVYVVLCVAAALFQCLVLEAECSILETGYVSILK
jgi:hypothetical protein